MGTRTIHSIEIDLAPATKTTAEFLNKDPSPLFSSIPVGGQDGVAGFKISFKNTEKPTMQEMILLGGASLDIWRENREMERRMW